MEQSIVIPANFRDFLKSLLQEANMSSIDAEIYEGMVQELYLLLDNYLATVMVDHLSPQDLDVFTKMNEENKSKEELALFLNEKMPDHKEIFSKAFSEFKRLYLEAVTAKRGEALTQ
jgi:hypothetical protein